MLVCGICGKEFKTIDMQKYIEHVSDCARKKASEENRKLEEIKKMNKDLEEIKRLKTCYEGLLDDFKSKYPDAYHTNFPDLHEDSDKEAVLNLEDLIRLIFEKGERC